MKTISTLLVACLALAVAPACRAQAANSFRIHLKLDGIDGESSDTGHNGEIDVVTFKAGVMQRALANAAGGGASAGASDFKPLTVFKYLDLASAKLFLACATGQHIKTATLTVENTGSETATPARPLGVFFKIVLTDVLVASVNEDSSTTDQLGNLVESISLSYSKIQWNYNQNFGGEPGPTVTGGFDVRANKKLP
jgi:type VI secretion system secreted protein Hcp